MSIKKDILWRVGAVYVGMLAIITLILVKIVTIQFFQRDKWIQKAENTTLRDVRIPSNRGDILANDGERLLASSVPYYEVRMDLNCEGLSEDKFYDNIDSLAFRLSQFFADKSAFQYKTELVSARKKGSRYHLIRRNVNYLELKTLKTFPLFREGRYKGGIIYLRENERIKPHNSLASRTVGYLSEAGNIVGIEGAYNKALSGTEGVRLMQRLSGNEWMPVSDQNEIEPKDGVDVVTTIDINIQDVAESALRNQLVKQNALYGTAILMEVASGHIKAIVNLKRDSNGHYREMYNYAVGESSEPGSTFKLPVIMALLEDGFVDITDSVDTGDGTFTIYDKTIKDSEYLHGGYGTITVKRAFEVSSNVAMAKLVTRHYGNNETEFIERLYRFGLNNKLGVEIKGEGEPYINHPDDKLWSGISLAMMSHGYEIRLTPLQILSFYNAVANNGKMVKPQFVTELRKHGKTIHQYKTTVIDPSICSKATLKKVHEMLEGVVEEGTASNLRESVFKIAGKTGTAQLNYADKTKKLSHQASFVGYFPANNPKYSCIVVVNSPSRYVYYGNLVAGPVFLEIARKIYATNLELHTPIVAENKQPEIPYSKTGKHQETLTSLKHLGIPVSDSANAPWVVTTKHEHSVTLENRLIVPNLVPNVVQMGLKDALYLLESAGLRVKVIGRGSVQKQSIPPGTRIQQGDLITLEMSFTS